MFWLDTVILVTLGAGTLFGALSGMLRQVARLVGFGLALYGSIYFNATATQWLGNNLMEEADPRVVRAAAYVGVFLGVLLVVMLVTALLDRALVAAKLKPMDRLLGAGLGLVKTALILGALLMGIVLYAQPGPDGVMSKSVLAGHMVRAMDRLVVAIPGEFKQAVQTELGRLNLANLRKEFDDLNLDGPPP
jgi:membrane protein required for colicin V production